MFFDQEELEEEELLRVARRNKCESFYSYPNGLCELEEEDDVECLTCDRIYG